MRTQTTGTATMTETAGAANTPWDHEQAQSTVMARIEAGTMEEYARSVERRYVEKRGGAVRADVAFGVYCAAARAWEVAQERTAPTPEDRYLAGLARLDAAVEAAPPVAVKAAPPVAVKAAPPVREGDTCPLCGERRVQREYERGLRSWWLCCEDILCGWQERDPDQRGLLLDRRA